MQQRGSKRGVGAGTYCSSKSHIKTRQRHHSKAKRVLFSFSLKKKMMSWMRDQRYSPELVAAQWKIDGIRGVSHETIYKFIWTCKHSNKSDLREFKLLYKLLKHGKRRRKRGDYKDSRGLILNRISIQKRPLIVEQRK